MTSQEIIDTFWSRIAPGKEMVLATSNGDHVNSRTVSCAAVDGKIYFVTGKSMHKYAQMAANPNVSLCLFDVYMSGTVRDAGSLDAPENAAAMVALRSVYPEDMAAFAHIPGITLMEVTPRDGGFGRMATGGLFVVDFANGEGRELKL